MMTSFDVDYTLEAMRAIAQGNMTDDINAGYIPFDYSLGHTLNSFAFQGMAGFDLMGYSTGLRAKAGFENTLDLDKKLDFSKNGQSYSTERALWGWTTVPCAHIFGPRSVEGDAWLQNEYVRGPMYTTELQGGITLPGLKAGSFVRYTFGHQDQYNWNSDTNAATGDSVIDQNFIGSYEKSNFSRKNNEALVRAYANLNLRRGERYALNMFGSLGYRGGRSRNALSSNLSIEDDAKEKTRNIIVEAGPNINVRLGEHFHYIDAAVIAEYGYTRLNNTFERGVDGGSVETFRNSSVVVGDEVFWENFSYANQGHVDVGADLSTMFPVFSSPASNLGLGLILYTHTRYTRQTKFYGTNTTSGSENIFTVDARRINYIREVWFNSALMLQYMTGPYHLRFEITEPLLYSQMSSTRIKGPEPYEHEKRPLWISQQGMRVALYMSYALTLPFLR